MPKRAKFRFYEELNDFLPEDKKKVSFPYDFMGNPTVKDAIESIGVPHTEIDLILVNGNSVTFFYHLKDKDKVSVYPVFESMDISNVTRLREKPLREPKFILDVHLGKLSRYLRMLGFDTLFENNYNKFEIVRTAKTQKRIILTRNVSLLKIGEVTHGYWVRSQNPVEQLTETVRYFDLYSNINPLTRCIMCNGLITKTTKDSVINKLQPKTKLYYNEFYRCTLCDKVYWEGSHFFKMKGFVENFRKKFQESNK